MKRVEFILELDELLYVLPKQDRKESITFYLEIIDEKIEQGLSEDEAIASLGDINELVRSILNDDIKGKKRAKDFINEEKIKKSAVKIVNGVDKAFKKTSKTIKKPFKRKDKETHDEPEKEIKIEAEVVEVTLESDNIKKQEAKLMLRKIAIIIALVLSSIVIIPLISTFLLVLVGVIMLGFVQILSGIFILIEEILTSPLSDFYNGSSIFNIGLILSSISLFIAAIALALFLIKTNFKVINIAVHRIKKLFNNGGIVDEITKN